MKTYCLTLKTTPDRQAAANHRFKEDGLDNVRFFYGLDGPASGLSRLPGAGYRGVGTDYRIDPKGLAMTLSHYMLWLSLSTLQEDSYLILEDDAVPLAGWRQLRDNALAVIPPDPWILYLGSCCVAGHQEKEVAPGVWKMSKIGCTHAYVINRGAIAELVESAEMMDANVDSMICASLKKTQFYAVLPRVFDQLNTDLPA